MTDGRAPIRVRTYFGATQQVSGQQFEVDAIEASRHGYVPVAQAWEGPSLTVTYQLRPQAEAGHPGLGAGLAVVVGGAMVTLGAFLPWVSAPNLARAVGMDFGDGIWVLALGLLTALAGLLLIAGPSRGRRVLGMLFAILSLALGASDFWQIQVDITNNPTWTTGAGLWSILLGAIIALAGAVLARSRKGDG